MIGAGRWRIRTDDFQRTEVAVGALLVGNGVRAIANERFRAGWNQMAAYERAAQTELQKIVDGMPEGGRGPASVAFQRVIEQLVGELMQVIVVDGPLETRESDIATVRHELRGVLHRGTPVREALVATRVPIYWGKRALEVVNQIEYFMTDLRRIKAGKEPLQRRALFFYPGAGPLREPARERFGQFFYRLVPGMGEIGMEQANAIARVRLGVEQSGVCFAVGGLLVADFFVSEFSEDGNGIFEWLGKGGIPNSWPERK